MKIILASMSKRRSMILSSCGIRHKVIASGAKESLKGRSPSRVVMTNAKFKAEKVVRAVRSGYIIGADTICMAGKKIIGKPSNALHAKRILQEISGRSISVYTGLSVIDAKNKRALLGYEKTVIKVKKIKPDEILKYFRLLGPYDKAGGFSIEGAGSFIFDDIRGSYYNVLGLPTAKLKSMLEELGCNILDIIKI